jgi:hypothetical protein
VNDLYQTQVVDGKQFAPLLKGTKQKKYGQPWRREL